MKFADRKFVDSAVFFSHEEADYWAGEAEKAGQGEARVFRRDIKHAASEYVHTVFLAVVRS